MQTAIRIFIGFICVFVCLPAKPQCNLKLISTQTFGRGANPGSPLSAGRTPYQYTPNACPGEGYYTLINKTPDCFAGGWFSDILCCTTGDFNGYVMLINASKTPGTVYIDTIYNLCRDIKFTFSAVISNLSRSSFCGGNPVKPNLTLTVESLSGQVINRYTTGFLDTTSITTTYNVDFSPPEGQSSVVIRITSDVPGGCGNDFFLDDVDVGVCSSSVIAGVLTPMGSFQTHIDRCANDSSFITLSATLEPGYSEPYFQWQINNGTQWLDIPDAKGLVYTFTPPSQTGSFKYRLAVAEKKNIGNDNCRVISNEITITVHLPSSPVQAISNSPVCANTHLQLSASDGSFFKWTGPGGFTSADQKPVVIATPSLAGLYTVSVTDATGCTSMATTEVEVLPAPVISVNRPAPICIGDSALLEAGGGNIYSWTPPAYLSNPNTSQTYAKAVQTTTYTVSVTGINNCTDTANTEVVVYKRPIANAGEDKTILSGQSVILDGIDTGTTLTNYTWLPYSTLNDNNLLQPTANPPSTTVYILKAFSPYGCGSSFDSMIVKVYPRLAIPSAFSPNGDKLNDVWMIPALSVYPKAKLYVYNRFGMLVYKTDGAGKGWDGTYRQLPQPVGVYSYLLFLKEGSPTIKGTLILIR